MAINEGNAAVHAAGGSVEALFNSGTLNIYSGTQPATADTALSGNTLLASLTFAATAFGTDTNGVATAAAIGSATAAATGTATFFRVLESNGTTAVMDGTVGTSGADLNLSTTSIVAGGTVSVSSFIYTQTK
jgi:hypothetical protein